VLPALASRTSDLVLELMAPPTGCARAEATARAHHAPITAQQAPSNQSDYVALGKAARARGVVPDLLRPTCEDLAAVNDAGDGAVAATLTFIARATAEKVVRLLARHDARRDAAEGACDLVLTYGGLLHNDASPPAERLAWSFGPALQRATGDRYVELDLVDPAFIAPEEEAWRRLPWVASYAAAQHGERAVLFRPAPGSFVLVLPVTESPD